MLNSRDLGRRTSSAASRYAIIIISFLTLSVLLLNYLHSGKNINTEHYPIKVGPSGLSESTPVVESQTKELTPVIGSETKKMKIAYAITVTKDGSFLDGALVLGHSAKKVHDRSSGFVSKYDADLVAFVAPSVIKARPILEAYGWRVLEKPLPVEIADIENNEYAEKMRNSGCCGADEFLKLWAYTLTEYHRVVHLDMDSIVFQNMVRSF